ncbi:Cyclic di-GMP phosphodiesterase response regulator RpfG [Stieleria neptunia]|uniref:Cyclic di-GMP phosphodiesterase response regulator RpfG n=1 Tax=Stieleria neptunia TaxID=2527979 RepID=A0A518HVL1_9BACT|nr:HD domain-containing phosphohydrolase [Stieleria neptunia]QDV44886.1 Cyclic di-GMP phosphodiesterase response regulator RpfG [Stieleria neptunia]
MNDRILIVDDDPIIRQMISSTLRQGGFEVVTAEDGRGALERLKEGNTRLVISDWQMPEMNGIDLCCQIRNGDFGGYVYLILLTTMDSVAQRVEGLVSGADDFVSKPFHPSELIARVNVGKRVLQLETREALIFSLAKLAESRDPETGHHIERVQCYSRCLAEQLVHNPKFAETITPQYIQLIYQTSPLHDIGKVGVPDAVLLKPGKLTDEEFLAIKAHPRIGAETLQGAIQRSPEASFLKMAYDIALSHHEKYDGSGYPEGLVGDAIPLSARIVALADVYDALTTNRVYKDAYSHERSESIIVQGRGSHFDPDVVDAFLEIETTFMAIRRQFDDSRDVDTLQPISAAPISADGISADGISAAPISADGMSVG